MSSVTVARNRPSWWTVASYAMRAGIVWFLLVAAVALLAERLVTVDGVLGRLLPFAAQNTDLSPRTLAAAGGALFTAGVFTPLLVLLMHSDAGHRPASIWVFAGALTGTMAGTLLPETRDATLLVGAVAGVFALRAFAFLPDGDVRPGVGRPRLVAAAIVLVALGGAGIAVRDAWVRPLELRSEVGRGAVGKRDALPPGATRQSGLLHLYLENTGVRTVRIASATVTGIHGATALGAREQRNIPNSWRSEYPPFAGRTIAPGRSGELTVPFTGSPCPGISDAALRVREAGGRVTSLPLRDFIDPNQGC